MDEATRLLTMSGGALRSLFGAAAGFELKETEGAVLCFTGEPILDFNMLLLGDTPLAPDLLCEAVARAKSLRLPLMVLLAGTVAEDLAELAESLGLSAAGAIPLMALRRAPQEPGGQPHIGVEGATDADGWRRVGSLVSEAFGLDPLAVDRVLSASLAQASHSEAYIARLGDKDVGAVTITRHDGAVGLWSMATSPAFQRRGLGKSLLLEVMARLRRQGFSEFFLLASAAGQHLYEAIGFEVICPCAVWTWD